MHGILRIGDSRDLLCLASAGVVGAVWDCAVDTSLYRRRPVRLYNPSSTRPRLADVASLKPCLSGHRVREGVSGATKNWSVRGSPGAHAGLGKCQLWPLGESTDLCRPEPACSGTG